LLGSGGVVVGGGGGGGRGGRGQGKVAALIDLPAGGLGDVAEMLGEERGGKMTANVALWEIKHLSEVPSSMAEACNATPSR
jgi:hypothetical protein